MNKTLPILALAGLSLSAVPSHAATWILDDVANKQLITVTARDANTGTGYSASILNIVDGKRFSTSGKLAADVTTPFDPALLNDSNLVTEFAAGNTVARVVADAEKFPQSVRDAALAAAEKTFRARIDAAKKKKGLLETAKDTAATNLEVNSSSIETALSNIDAIALGESVTNETLTTAFSAVKDAYAVLNSDIEREGSLAQNLAVAKLELAANQQYLAQAVKEKKTASEVAVVQKNVTDSTAAVKTAEAAITAAKNDLSAKVVALNKAAATTSIATPADKIEVATQLKKVVDSWAAHAKLITTRGTLQKTSAAATKAFNDFIEDQTLERQYDVAKDPAVHAYLSIAPADNDNWVIASVLRPGATRPLVFAGLGPVNPTIEGNAARFGFNVGNFVLVVNGDVKDPNSYLASGDPVAEAAVGTTPIYGNLFTAGRQVTILKSSIGTVETRIRFKNNLLTATSGDPSAATPVFAPLVSKLTVVNGLVQGTLGKDVVVGVLGTFGSSPADQKGFMHTLFPMEFVP